MTRNNRHILATLRKLEANNEGVAPDRLAKGLAGLVARAHLTKEGLLARLDWLWRRGLVVGNATAGFAITEDGNQRLNQSLCMAVRA